MYGIASQKQAPSAVSIGQEEVLAPFAAIEHLVADRHTNSLLEPPLHLLVRFDGGMQGPMPLRILHDQKGRPFVRNQVVPTSARPFTQWQTIVELVTTIKSLTKSSQVGFTSEPYAKLFPHKTGSAVAADQIGGCYFRGPSVQRSNGRYDTRSFLFKLHELGAIPNIHPRNSLSGTLENRLQRVLRYELVGLERRRAVIDLAYLLPRHIDRWVFQMQQRRPSHCQDDIHIHDRAGGKSRRAKFIGQTYATEHLHRARIAAPHLRQTLRLRFSF